jgi:monofunctional chorismate mutase
MDLKNARIEINKIDKEIVHLLEKRLNVVMEIGKYKKENKLPIYDEEREKLVISNCLSYLENKKYSHSIEEIYKQIMDSSKLLEL